MTCIQLENVTKTFTGKKAVDNLSLSIPKGSVYGFIGPNGSGKTTSLRMILSIIYPDSGKISVLGQNNVRSLCDKIGYLPEERGLYQKMKVKELIKFFAHLKSGKDVDKNIDKWLERFDLSGHANKKVEALSKGMGQKVQFISTVITNPEILILDEPFSGLDPVNTDLMRNAVLDMQKQGSTIVFSTHDMGTAEKMCDRIFMIFNGKKVLDGTLDTIQNEYGSDTLLVRVAEENKQLENLPGVERVTNFGQQQELKMKSGADPQLILAELCKQYTVQRFEIVKPSLHDIFVRIAGPEAQLENGK